MLKLLGTMIVVTAHTELTWALKRHTLIQNQSSMNNLTSINMASACYAYTLQTLTNRLIKLHTLSFLSAKYYISDQLNVSKAPDFCYNRRFRLIEASNCKRLNNWSSLFLFLFGENWNQIPPTVSSA